MADTAASTIHTLRASLNARVYRDIEILSTGTLYALAESITRAFAFDFDHAFGFFCGEANNIFQSEVRYELFADADSGGSSRSVKRTKIEQALPTVGTKMTFLFDYGD